MNSLFSECDLDFALFDKSSENFFIHAYFSLILITFYLFLIPCFEIFCL